VIFGRSGPAKCFVGKQPHVASGNRAIGGEHDRPMCGQSEGRAAGRMESSAAGEKTRVGPEGELNPLTASCTAYPTYAPGALPIAAKRTKSGRTATLRSFLRGRTGRPPTGGSGARVASVRGLETGPKIPGPKGLPYDGPDTL
jgi:hypothetical protein